MTQFMHDSESPDHWDGRGCALCEQADYNAAIAAFDQALRLDPNYCKSWNNRGNALCAQKRYAEALMSYDRAVALQPTYHQAWFNRGKLLAEMMAYGNAIESYDRAIAIQADPMYLHAKADLGLKSNVFASDAIG